MRVKHLAVAAAIAAFAPLTGGQESHHPQVNATPPRLEGCQGMGTGQMHEHMRRMQSEMAAIRAATSVEEKQRLMEEHFKTMESAMSTMRHMMP
jgi:hypothetical protein